MNGGCDNRGSAIALAAAILFGFLSHLTMLETVAVLVAWTAWVRFRSGDGAVRAGLRTVWIFVPAFLAILPLALCIVIGAKMSGFTVGGSSPFSLDAFASGYGGMIRYLFGLAIMGAGLGPDLRRLAVSSALSAWRWPGRRASLYVIGIVGLPILMMQVRLPNLEFPRYFLVSGTLLLVVDGRNARARL